ncbi:DUF3107 domain-containing protein [Alloscardovia theropitheci]|uniref:DUF3107 domain-containing protein n=1 Tax=Alloscardovia theropitheci TaxID=2496842 RepID=A0A4R0QYK3_9BIFI|nr:DUF3107 domain-containing protein [Alloscardovia theropitheci]TCD54721.1 DUF3107 domain-containing protein [Alloscardovia theropitheci]
MLVEIGIQHVSKIITVDTDETAEEVSKKVDKAINNHETLKITEKKGRVIVVPASTLAYAIVGSETARPVGFGAL